MSNYANAQLQIAIARKQSERASASAGGQDFSHCGPPSWDRSQWEAFKAQFGSYPFGPQAAGGYISPPHYDNAPDWVFELMGQRVPPIRMRNPQ